MKLPNGARAQVDVQRKLIDYCLDPTHRTGRHKARVFLSVLGITSAHALVLADALRAAARDGDARLKDRSIDADKYEIEFSLTGPAGSAIIRSGWIIERGSEIPRLTTCYVKPFRKGGAHAPRS